MEAAARRLAEYLQRAEQVVALTGAGVSTAAGLPDFRGPRGDMLLPPGAGQSNTESERFLRPVTTALK